MFIARTRWIQFVHMGWNDVSEDIYDQLVPKLSPLHLKTLHLVSRHFRHLVKTRLSVLLPRELHLDIPERFPNLTRLDLRRCWDQVNDVKLIALVNIFSRHSKLKLKVLNLSKCHGITDKGVEAISKHLWSLEELDLSGCRSPVPKSYVGYTGVSGATLYGLSRLKKLKLTWNPVTNAAFRKIAKLKDLTHLDLGECHQILDEVFLHFRYFIKMEVLNLDRTTVCYTAIATLTKLPFLSSLSLRQCSEIDDLCLSMICQLPVLSELNLGMNNVTDNGVQLLISMHLLKSLDLSYCTRLNGGWIQGWEEDQKWNLKKLNLADCNWVTNDILGVISQKMPNLEDLTLHNCTQITEQGLSHLIACPITVLDVSDCNGVDDRSLEVFSKMSNLAFLDLTFCVDVTDVGLGYLRNPNLKSLVLNCCRKITTAGIYALHPLASRLSRLEISGCNRINTDVLFFISNTLTQLESLNLSWLAINDIQFKSLKNLKHLTYVDVQGCLDLSENFHHLSKSIF